MEEIKNGMVKVVIDNYSLAVAKGYSYVNKDNKQRYKVEDVYYLDDGKISRKYVNALGDFYYTIELVDVVVETFPMKDGTIGSKTYLLSEVPYLANSVEEANEETLKNYLSFKIHR